MDKERIAELRNPHSGLTIAETKEVLDALEAALARAEGAEAKADEMYQAASIVIEGKWNPDQWTRLCAAVDAIRASTEPRP